MVASVFDWSVTAADNDDADTDINWLEGQQGATVNNSARAMMAKVASIVKMMRGAYTTTNTGDAYVIAVDFPPASLSKGWFGIVRFNAANTGAATLEMTPLAATTLRDAEGTALGSGAIVANALYLVAYDTTASQYRIVSKVSSTLTSASITDFTEAVQDVLGALTGFGGSGLTFTYDDGAGTVALAVDVSEIDATATDVLTGTSTATVVTPDSLAALWEKGSDEASAGTVAFGEGGYFHITGTTTITDIDFDTAKDGRYVSIIFDGILTLTHNGTTLKLPGDANITTAAGDRAGFVQDSTDNVICLWYTRADGTPLVAPGISRTLLGTANPSSGTTSSITLGDTNAYHHLEIEISGVGFSGTGPLTIAASGDGGTNYGTATTLCLADHSGEEYYGILQIFGHKLPHIPAHIVGAVSALSGSTPHVNTGVNSTILKHATGGGGDIDALRLAGGTFDAGASPAWRVYGVK